MCTLFICVRLHSIRVRRHTTINLLNAMICVNGKLCTGNTMCMLLYRRFILQHGSDNFAVVFHLTCIVPLRISLPSTIAQTKTAQMLSKTKKRTTTVQWIWRAVCYILFRFVSQIVSQHARRLGNSIPVLIFNLCLCNCLLTCARSLRVRSCMGKTAT